MRLRLVRWTTKGEAFDLRIESDLDPGIRVLFSYGDPVAMRRHGVVVREERIRSKTTELHIKTFSEGAREVMECRDDAWMGYLLTKLRQLMPEMLPPLGAFLRGREIRGVPV